MDTIFYSNYTPMTRQLLTVFGVAATYTPLNTGSVKTLSVFFDQEATRQIEGYDATTVKYAKVIECLKEDLAGCDYQGTFVIAGTSYKIVDINEDDTEMIEFIVK